MINATDAPTFNETLSPSASPTVPEVNETLTPSEAPTTSPTDFDTGAPTGVPTIGVPSFSPSASPTGAPTNNTDVEVIRLPTYKNKDPVDGIFIVVVITIIIVIVGACLQSINKRKNREKSERIKRLHEAEFNVNEEDGDTEIRLKSFSIDDDEV